MTNEVDAHDEDDSHATEVAVSIAIAEALAHPPNPSEMTADRVESILDATVGTTLRFYGHRVLQSFIRQLRSGAPVDDADYAIAQRAVDRGIASAIDQTGESVRDIIQASAARAQRIASPSGTGSVIEQGLDTEAEVYNRLRVSMTTASRLLTTRARELSKYEFALKVGAAGKVWRTRRDGRVRTSHGDLEGDFRGMRDPYITIRGNSLQRPGDPNAPLSETINCRCRLSYRMPA